MPNCISLYKIGASEPTPFTVIDTEMRAYFGVPDNGKYLNGWYNHIAFLLAMGNSFDVILSDLNNADFRDEDYLQWIIDEIRIIDWMKVRYTPNAWVEIGK